MILKNSELYLYSDGKNMILEQMLVLTPGVFISKKGEQRIEGGSIHAKIHKIYPVEIWVGGQISNNGINKSQFHKGNFSGLITIYFEKQDIQTKWT